MTPRNMDQNLRARIEALLEKGVPQKSIAEASGLNHRLVSLINSAYRARLLKENPPPEPVTKEEAVEENYQDNLRRKLRKAIPIRKRVVAIAELVSSTNPSLQKYGLEQLNLIEGLGKGDNKPYEPGPLFIVDTIPDLRPVKRQDDDEEESRTTTKA